MLERLCSLSADCPELLAPKSREQPLHDRLVLKNHTPFLGTVPLLQVQAAAVPPAGAELNTTIQVNRSGGTERREEFGKMEMAGAVDSPSLCPRLGNVC